MQNAANKRPGHDRVKLKQSTVWWIAQWRDQQGRLRQRRLGENSLMPWHVAAAKAIVFSCELRQQRTGEPPPAEIRLSNNRFYWLAVVGRENAKFSLTLCRKDKFTREQALEACAQGEKELAKLTAVSIGPDGMRWTLAKWIERYIACRAVDRAEATRKIDYYCGRYLRAYFGDEKPIAELTRADAAAWRAALADGSQHAQINEIHTGRPSHSTVCKYVRCVKAMFAEAANVGIIDANPFARLKAGNGITHKQWAYLDRPAMQRIFDACPDVYWRALFSLCRFAGLRRGEALCLKWRDVDFAGNKLRLHFDCERETTKERPRIVPIEPARCPSGLADLLQEAFSLADDGAERVMESIRHNNANRRAADIIEKARVATYAKVFHTLRKCCEMDWAAHYPQHVVSEWVGHSILVSARHYLRVPEELYAPPPARRGMEPTTSEESNAVELLPEMAGAR